MKKQTKIVATISDIKCDIPFLTELVKEGVNVFRMNTAHQTPKDTLAAMKNMRIAAPKVPIIIDTKGPEIRTTELEGEPIIVKKGEKIIFVGNEKKKTSTKAIYLNYNEFHKDVPIGTRFLYDDGEIGFKVILRKATHLVCQVQNNGTIKGKKSINVPSVNIDLPSLTKKDKMYVEFSAKNDVDFIAHSFIRNKEDLIAVQEILDKHKSKVKLIAKIENREGVDNIDEILDHCSGVMVARGDLAIEIPLEKVPAIQKRIIRKCIEKRKIAITATQLLHTMIKNPRPTRAEVSDVANAVYDETDCLMLSGETAYGKYAVGAVKVMTKIAKEIESEKRLMTTAKIKTIEDKIPNFLAHSAIKASLELNIEAILTDTLGGKTAKYLSAFKGKSKIYALCYNERIMRELAFSYGVYADKVPKKFDRNIFKKKIETLIREKVLKPTDLVIILSGGMTAAHSASNLRISTAEKLLK